MDWVREGGGHKWDGTPRLGQRRAGGPGAALGAGTPRSGCRSALSGFTACRQSAEDWLQERSGKT